MDYQQISNFIIVVGAIVGAAYGIPQAILHWKDVLERIESDKQEKEKMRHAISGTKQFIRIVAILNGDLIYSKESYRGFRDEISRLLEETEYEVIFRDAVGSSRNDEDDINRKAFDEAISSFNGELPDFLVVFGTRVAQYAVKNYSNIYPIIFVGVTDPVKSKIIPSSSACGIAGVTYGISMAERLDFLRKAFPLLSSIGYIYHESVPQDLALKDEFIRYVSELPGYPDKFPVINIAEKEPDMELKGKIDIFIGWAYLNDKMAKYLDMGLPLAGNNIEQCRVGAVASTGNDDVKVGRLAAEKILYKHLVQGISLKNLPLIQPGKDDKTARLFAVNLTTARKYGLSVLERNKLEKIARVYS
ncbi:MAG: hypothetical protein HGB12_09650 [Bacteroidetes bacterium]|nr:hypothetical protein [Bacteroidota bacterium]